MDKRDILKNLLNGTAAEKKKAFNQIDPRNKIEWLDVKERPDGKFNELGERSEPTGRILSQGDIKKLGEGKHLIVCYHVGDASNIRESEDEAEADYQ